MDLGVRGPVVKVATLTSHEHDVRMGHAMTLGLASGGNLHDFVSALERKSAGESRLKIEQADPLRRDRDPHH